MNTPFFEAGVTYVNAAPYTTPVHLQIVHRLQCLAVARHPGNSELHAIGWIEIHPGVWVAGSVGTEHLYRDHWTEQPR